MTAIDTLVAQLAQYRNENGIQGAIFDHTVMIAAMQFLAGGGVPAGSTNPTSATPPGRLTLTTGVPVLTADVTAANNIFYTPYNGNVISLFNGTSFNGATFAQTSQLLTDATKSPAATIADHNYDLFAWSDAGTFRVTRGPGWFTNTNRGNFAGTTELTRNVGGIFTNVWPIVNGPPANQGTYVGSIHTDLANKVNMMFAPAPVAGGASNHLDVFNMYNRMFVSSINTDNTATWNYTLAAYQAKNNNLNNAIQFLIGVNEDAFLAANSEISSTTAGESRCCNIGFDTVAADPTALVGLAGGSTNRVSHMARLSRMPDVIGSHLVIPLESGEATGVTSWYGNTTIAGVQYVSQMQLNYRM